LKTRIDKSSERVGFALILVMITILALTTLVASFAISMNTEVRLARNSDYDSELEWMGRSGIELARFALANKCQDQKGYDALNQFWAGGTSPCSNDIPQISLKDVPLGHGKFSVTITDMERKWDINNIALPQHPQPEIMQKALSIIGVTDAGLASAIQDSIFDWCNPNSLSGFSGAKDEYYMHLNPPYYCKGGPIDDLSELLLIKGISPEIYWGSNATNHPVSAYQQHGGGPFNQPASGRPGSFSNKDNPYYPVGLHDLFSPLGGKLNINTASLLALELIPGIDENAAAHILQQRAGPDGVDGTDDDLPFQNIGEINSGFGGGQGPGRPGPGAPGPGGIAGAPPPGTAAQGLAAYIDVRSYIFQVKVDAEINNYHRIFYGIVSRSGNGAQQLKCVRFYWE
jgi:general secretion pathway protein K